MSTRRLGPVLIAVGVVGLIGVPVLVRPGLRSPWLDRMNSMHGWMMGALPGSKRGVLARGAQPGELRFFCSVLDPERQGWKGSSS